MIEIIGISGNPQQGAWIERFQQDNSDVKVVEIVNAFLVKPRLMISFLEDSGLLERQVDGFVFDTSAYDNATVHAILAGLTERGFKMYSARGETSRPRWQA